MAAVLHYLMCLAVLVVLSLTKSESVVIENGGYERIVVSLSSVADDKVGIIIEYLKEVLNSASKILHTLTETRLHFREFLFLVPKTWPVPEDIEIDNSFNVREDEAIMRVVRDEKLYSEMPYVLQHAGCQQKGKTIYLPEDSLTTSTFSEPFARHLVHAWSRYRYGMFSEHGFPDDPLYPEAYGPLGTSNNTLLTHNSCSFPRLKAEGRLNGKTCEIKLVPETGLPEDSKCKIELIADPDQRVNTSFLALPGRESVSHFCDSSVHEKEKSNKHNVLCNGESAFSVFQKSPDFSKDTFPEADTSITVKYVIDNEEDTEISIIYGVGVEYKDRKNVVDKLLSRFIRERVPNEGTVKVLPYPKRKGNPNFQHLEEKLSTDKERKTLENQVISEELRDTKSILEEALKYYVDEMNPSSGSSLLLVATGAERTSGTLKNIREKLVELRIHVDLILYPLRQRSGKTEILPDLGNIVHSIGGRVWAVDDEEKALLSQLQLNQALFNVFRGHNWNQEITIARQVILPNVISGKQDIEVPFYILDAMAESITTIIYDDDIAKGTPAVSRDSINLVLGSKDKTQLMPEIIQEIPSRFTKTLNADDVRVRSGKLQFTILKKPSGPVVVDISAKLKQDHGELVLNAWFSNMSLVTLRNPPVIYAYLEVKGLPVRHANVTAVISRPDGSTVTMSLLDNGLGEPDVTKDDGIYSRYFTDFKGKAGYYSVKIISDNSHNSAEIITTSSHKPEVSTAIGSMCCGSIFPVGGTRKVGTTFVREFELGSFYGMESKKYNFPPSRIVDLRAVNFNSNLQTFELVWTAPGEDFDQGKAQKYMIHAFRNYSKALSFSRGESGTEKDEPPPAPSEYGTEEKISIKLKSYWRAGNVYYAIRAVDAAGNSGAVSNVVTVYQSVLELNGGMSSPISLPQALAIGFVALVFLVIIIITVVVLYRHFVKERAKRENDTSAVLYHPNRSSSVDSLGENRDLFVLQRNSRNDSNALDVVPVRPAPLRPIERENRQSSSENPDGSVSQQLFSSTSPNSVISSSAGRQTSPVFLQDIYATPYSNRESIQSEITPTRRAPSKPASNRLSSFIPEGHDNQSFEDDNENFYDRSLRYEEHGPVSPVSNERSLKFEKKRHFTPDSRRSGDASDEFYFIPGKSTSPEIHGSRDDTLHNRSVKNATTQELHDQSELAEESVENEEPRYFTFPSPNTGKPLMNPKILRQNFSSRPNDNNSIVHLEHPDDWKRGPSTEV